MRRLGLTTDSGLDEAAVDALLESLSSNTTFTDQLLANADTCIEAMNATLTADQQGVYVLACLKLRFKADCMLQNENATLCLNAKTLKCPIGITPLFNSSTLSACKPPRSGFLSSMFSGIRSFFSPMSRKCPMKEEKVRNVANCSLQEAGLASGDTVDLSAVETAITDNDDTTDSEKALQLAVLTTCRDDGADTVDALLDCWAAEAAEGCATSKAERLATGNTGSTGGRGGGGRGSGRGQRRFGGFGRGGSLNFGG